MAYYIAIKSRTGYVILPEAFEVRSNAERHARRHRWDDEQRLIIEANQYPGGGSDEMQTSASCWTYSSASAKRLGEDELRTML